MTHFDKRAKVQGLLGPPGWAQLGVLRNVIRTFARRLIPIAAVAAVLAASYLSPVPTQAILASSTGYGYGNNCGVKGDGFHDHGKPCPNRPFPGHKDR